MIALRISLKSQSVGMRVTLACVATLFFRYMLDFLYLRFVTRFYAGYFPLDGNNSIRLLESYAIVLMLCILIASSLYRRWRPSGIVPILYFVVIMVPLSSLYGLANAPPLFMYTAVASMALLIAVRDLLQTTLNQIKPSRELVYIVITGLFGITIYVYGWLVFTGGFVRLNLDLLKVYDIRAEFAANLGPLMGYFFPWQGFVINIYGLLYAYKRRKFLLLTIFAVAQLLLFGMTGHKSFLLAPFLAFGVYLIWEKQNPFFLFIMGATFLVLASYAYFLITDSLIVPAIFVQRLFFLPAKLHLLYYDFFSQPDHPFYMLSDSILRGIIRNPYDMPMMRVIALTYWGTESINPNVGYLGDAYANFGVSGMFLFSGLLGVVLWIVDSVGSGLPSNFVAAIIAVPAMALTQSPLFTSMGTHGFILAILMIWITRAIEKAGHRLR